MEVAIARRIAALQLSWLAAQWPAHRRFKAAMADPDAAQQRRLSALLPALGPSLYGREVGLDSVRNLRDLEELPTADFASLAPWVDRIAAGERNVLSTEAVEVLEPTGGSTGGTKLVPTTARLRSEFAEAVGVWMVDLHRHHPELLGTRQYWSVSRAVRDKRTTAGGVPIGFDDDASYFGTVERWAIRRLMAVQSDVADSSSLEDWRTRTAVALIEAEDLGLISVWSPTFLTVLMSWMFAQRDTLAPLLSGPTARRFTAATAGGQVDGAVLWPQLALLSAWADGFAASHAPAMTKHFPGVSFQPKGLLATEGVVSFPLVGHEGAALAVTSHVIELRDLSDGRIVRLSQARRDAEYQPLLTTGGGFVRYGLPDAIRVVGFVGRIPLVRLTGRLDKGSDRVGEKLTDGFVQQAVDSLWERPPAFRMLVPVEDPLGYVLVVDSSPPTGHDLDAALGGAYHYAYARDLGQLAPARVVLVPDAWTRWEAGVDATGLLLGDQKPSALETRPVVIDHLLRARY